MPYKIDPIKDWPLAEEFRLTPIGRHSPNLMRVLNALRFDPSGYQTVLISTIPFKEWVLGTMPPDRGEPILQDDSQKFSNREDAEWAVFCTRWAAHTGQQITSSRHEALPETPPC